MRFLSMFSGIDAASAAWNGLGWKAAAFCEIEKFPSSVLAHHYPDVPNLGDVTKADFDAIGPIDLAVFGSPCQSFSVAGKRLGLDDARGNLALLAGRIVYRKRPRWFVFENVPGLLSSDDGWDFGTLLAAYAGHPSGSVFKPPADGWGNGGVIVQANGDSYGLAWRILDAQYFGIPQRRRRVFVVGYLGDWRRAAAVLFERHSLSGNPAPRREAGPRASVSPTLRTGGNRTGGDRPPGTDVDTVETLQVVAALTANGVGTCGADDNQGQAGHLIQTFDRQSNCEYGTDPIASTIHARDYKGATDLVAHTAMSAPTIAETLSVGANQTTGFQSDICARGSAVRRLTPRECERLQGFKDDYTAVPHRGKPAADGPRYKALGNSMAVPVMAWIGQRIAAVEALATEEQRAAA